MNDLWYAAQVALRNLRNYPVQSALTVLVAGLAVAVTITVVVLSDAVRQGVITASDAFGVLVIGPKGSAQQLALNTILLQDVPVGVMDMGAYEELLIRNPNLVIVPLAMGDNIGNIPIVGTNASFFKLRRALDSPPAFQPTAGRLFTANFESVLGAEAARLLGLRVGDSFYSSHGAMRGLPGDVHNKQAYTVVGILARANSPYDRAVFTTVESVWLAHEAPQGVDPSFLARPRTDTQTAIRGKVTAALVLPFGVSLNEIYRISQQVNNGTAAQAIFPGAQLGELFNLLNQGQAILNVVGGVALGMASLTVLLALYGATLARQQSIAVMRSLGAKRRMVFVITLLEAIWLAFFGVLFGAALGHVVAALIGSAFTQNSAIPIETRILWQPELVLLLIPILLGAVSGLLPAALAYRLNVVEKLFGV